MNTTYSHLPSPAPTPTPAQTPNPNALFHAEQAQTRRQVEQHLLSLSQDLWEMEVCAGDVGQGMEDAMPTYLSKINHELLALHELSEQMRDSVPHQVVEDVDANRNPHKYTKNVLTRAVGENQYALGRMLGLESFRSQLQTAISSEFPTIPLPDRRHQPIREAKQNGDHQTVVEVFKNEVKQEGRDDSGERARVNGFQTG